MEATSRAEMIWSKALLLLAAALFLAVLVFATAFAWHVRLSGSYVGTYVLVSGWAVASFLLGSYVVVGGWLASSHRACIVGHPRLQGTPVWLIVLAWIIIAAVWGLTRTWGVTTNCTALGGVVCEQKYEPVITHSREFDRMVSDHEAKLPFRHPLVSRVPHAAAVRLPRIRLA